MKRIRAFGALTVIDPLSLIQSVILGHSEGMGRNDNEKVKAIGVFDENGGREGEGNIHKLSCLK